MHHVMYMRMCFVNQKKIIDTPSAISIVTVTGFRGHTISLPFGMQGASTQVSSKFPAHLNHLAETSFYVSSQTDPCKPSDKHSALLQKQVASEREGAAFLSLVCHRHI